MGDSGQLMSAPAGAFPHMMSREMPSHDFRAYHTAPLETEAFPPHCRASVRAGTTFTGQRHAFTCSLEQAVSSAVLSLAHPAALNSCISATMTDGVVGQKQLLGEVVNTVQALPSQTTSGQCVNVWSSLVTSQSTLSTVQHLATYATLAMSLAGASTAAQTSTVSVMCTKPVSSSSLLCHQQHVPQRTDQKVLLCSEENSDNGPYTSVKDGKMLSHQLDRADDVVSGGAVKVEPKVEVETSSIEVSQHPSSVDFSVDIKPEQLKHSIKSEVVYEEGVDQIHNGNVKLSDAEVTEKSACDTELKKQSLRKGNVDC